MSSTSGVLCEAETANLSRVPWFHPQFFCEIREVHVFSVLWYVFLFFACIRSYVPNVACISALSILDCSSVFSTVYLL
jgi:hypothetical protein